MSRARNFTFTQNNYPNTELVDSIECKYIIYGKEVGESGTPHLQGFVSFANAKTLSAVIKLLPGCHVEVAKTVNAAIEYCKKESNYVERGEKPCTQVEKGAKNAERWKRARESAAEGNFDEIPDDIRFKYYKNIEYFHQSALKQQKLDDTEEDHEWYYGDTGTGKSRKAREENPDAYLKMCNKWWDGYNGEDVVIIEDFDKKHDVLGHHMKIWLDRYPFLAEVKGGSIKIRPKKIIVTSNYHPEQIWEDNGTYEPIMRRIKITEFNKTPFS